MKKFDGYLIASDIDGTLVYEQGKVSEENLQAIQYFKDNGGLFTIFTGRTTDYLKNFVVASNAPAVVFNGTVIVDSNYKTILFDYPLKYDYIKAVKHAVKNFECIDVAHVMGLYDGYYWRKTDSEDIVDWDIKENIYKAVFTIDNPYNAVLFQSEMIREFGDIFNFDRSWDTGVELLPKDTGKGMCLEKIKGLCSGVHTTIAVGDYENDISMIKAADIGYATENALDSVKAVADRIAPANTENAIAYIINSL